MSCVCGHPRNNHTDRPLSVPLTLNRPALYDVGTIGIAVTHPKATYTGNFCWCGCTMYETDPVKAA